MQNTGEHSPAQHPEPTTGELSAIRITGQDRLAFLQGQLTQDTKRLLPDHPLLAGWASPKGRLLCVLWLADWQNAVWLILPGELAEHIAKRLKMFVLRSDVQVEVSEASVYPTRRDNLTLPRTNYDSPENKSINNCFYNDNEFSILPATMTEMGIRVEPEKRNNDVDPADLAQWRLMNIRAGLPIVWQATAEEFVPQMVNLDLLDAISFTKGCYVGQEIVARTQNLGRIKRRMYAFKTAAVHLDVPAVPGQPVYGDDGIVGQIVDAATAESGAELLAVIRIDCLEQALSLEPDGKNPLAEQPLPYAIP